MVRFFPFQTGSNWNYSNLFTVPKKSLHRRRQLKIFFVWTFWCFVPRSSAIKTRASKSKASATHNKEKISCLFVKTCMNKYVQTLSHTSQQKIRNTTTKKREKWKEKKSTTWHLPTSCMHPIKPVTLGLQRVKGREKNQNKIKRKERKIKAENKVKSKGRDM